MTSDIRRSACSAAQVPPYCFLVSGVPVVRAAINAADALGIRDSVSVLTMFWEMRAVAEGLR